MDDVSVRRRVPNTPPAPPVSTTSFSAAPLPSSFTVSSGGAKGGSGGGATLANRPYGVRLLAPLALLLGAVYVSMYHVNSWLPAPGALENTAMHSYLAPLALLGPRPTGSPANEQHAVKLLLSFLADIKSQTHKNLQLSIDHQVVSGSFSMTSLDGVISSYANVQNIVARLSPPTVADHSVMINCHYDSAISSPGASDDLASCAIMLAVLKKLALDGSTELRHNIIFLFNGAEENMLQGSHGFITQHKWARSVRAYVNLEACGAGGRELVFQSGPGHSWLIKAYADVVPYPFANIIGQEVFQSNIIPSDTDFRIFRDFGGIPGLDTAFISNGYVYHTRHDHLQHVTPGSLQRAGENVLAIVRHLAATDIITSAQSQDVGSVVFLDVFGLFMLVIPGWLNTVNAVTLIVTIAATTYLSCRRNGVLVWQLVAVCVLQLLSWLLAGAMCLLVAHLLDRYNATMAWYAVRGWIVGLYVTMSWGVILLVQQSLLPLIMGKSVCVWRCERLMFDSTQLLLCSLLAVMSQAGLGSSLLLQLLVAGPTLVRSTVLHLLAPALSTGVWLVAVYVASQTLSLALMLYSSTFLLEFFVPILGRFGPAVNPELVVAVITLLLTVLTTIYLSTLMTLVARVRRLALALLTVSLLCTALVIATPLGFPYSGRQPHVRPQRHWLQHVERVFYAANGSEASRDSGFLLSQRDRNGRVTNVARLVGLEEGVAEGRGSEGVAGGQLAARAVRTEDHCDSLLYCGIPYYYPVRRSSYMNDYYPGPAPKFATPLSYSVKKEVRKDSIVRLHFHINGPDHMTLQLSPVPAVQLVHCSLLADRSSYSTVQPPAPPTGVPFRGRPVYFLYYSWGVKSAAWRFYIDLLVSTDGAATAGDTALVDVVLNGHQLHGSGAASDVMQQLLSRWPDWAVPVPFSSQLVAFSAPVSTTGTK